MTEPVPAVPDPDEPIDLTPIYDDMTADKLGCLSCLGGFIPAGRHLILGLVYVACPACDDPCRCCNGTGLFPADTTCIDCLTDALAVVGYTPTFCHTCAGVLAVHPTGEVSADA
jgi:hypothetical protein